MNAFPKPIHNIILMELLTQYAQKVAVPVPKLAMKTMKIFVMMVMVQMVVHWDSLVNLLEVCKQINSIYEIIKSRK